MGDWGTPFGLLIEHLLDLGEAEAAHELSVGDLNDFYRAARVKFDNDAAFAERSRLRVVALQSGDKATLRLWRLLVEESEKYFLAVYDKLGVLLTREDFCGESFYNDMLAPVVDELDRLGLLRESEGAQCVFPQGFTGRDGVPHPIIVRKSDGGYGYGATDLAAIRYRTQDLKAIRLLYVVGTPQHQHLEMVYQTAREAGWLVEPARATHVGFGQVLGADGKKLASRAGETVKLADLLDEAVARASALVQDKNPDLDAETQAEVAQAVGIGKRPNGTKDTAPPPQPSRGSNDNVRHRYSPSHESYDLSISKVALKLAAISRPNNLSDTQASSAAERSATASRLSHAAEFLAHRRSDTLG